MQLRRAGTGPHTPTSNIERRAIGSLHPRVATHQRTAPPAVLPRPQVTDITGIPVPEYAAGMSVKIDASHPETYKTKNTLGRAVLHDPKDEEGHRG